MQIWGNKSRKHGFAIVDVQHWPHASGSWEISQALQGEPLLPGAQPPSLLGYWMETFSRQPGGLQNRGRRETESQISLAGGRGRRGTFCFSGAGNHCTVFQDRS
jgi:hypothetical protein